MKIFLDESGNTGDLIKEKIDLNFADQRIFVLSAIEVKDTSLVEIEKKILELKNKYKIHGNELKSTKIFNKKPIFILDLVTLLNEFDVKLYIEVVDKLFYLCTAIVNSQIIPPYFVNNNDSTQLQRNIFADYLTRNLTETEYQDFANSCMLLSENSLNASWYSLLRFARNKRDEFSISLFNNIIETIDDYKIIKENYGGDEAIKKFVPIPDIGKNGRKVHLLPQISCLTNIIARVNHRHDLEDITFIHDEQKHFDEIMMNNVGGMSSLDKIEIKFKNADFNIYKEPNVSFNNISSNCIAIQIADIISGSLMRYTQKLMSGDDIESIYQKVFEKINSLACRFQERGTGINFVMDISNLRKLGVNVMSPMIITDAYSKRVADIFYNM